MEIKLEPNKDYSLSLTGNEIVMLSQAIMELPAKFANPLIAKIQDQLKPTDEVEEVNHKTKWQKK